MLTVLIFATLFAQQTTWLIGDKTITFTRVLKYTVDCGPTNAQGQVPISAGEIKTCMLKFDAPVPIGGVIIVPHEAVGMVMDPPAATTAGGGGALPVPTGVIVFPVKVRLQ